MLDSTAHLCVTLEGVSVALGIDLGTTNSVAAIATPTGVEFILGGRSERVHPSVVAFPASGGVVVGAEAKRYRLSEPNHVIHSAKRFIGQNMRAPLVQLALTGVHYQVTEGPNQQPKPLGTLLLDGLIPRPRGDLKIEVQFRVDADGILHVRASDQKSGERQEVRLHVFGAPVDEP